jgi:hypothetical protein
MLRHGSGGAAAGVALSVARLRGDNVVVGAWIFHSRLQLYCVQGATTNKKQRRQLLFACVERSKKLGLLDHQAAKAKAPPSVCSHPTR